MKYNFVIIGTIEHESKDSVIDFLQKYMTKDKVKFPEINTIHIFGDNISEI
jgi:hypothetical protein